MDARDNTSTNPGTATGIPIYPLNDTLLANDNADLWDSTIAVKLDVDENAGTVADAAPLRTVAARDTAGRLRRRGRGRTGRRRCCGRLAAPWETRRGSPWAYRQPGEVPFAVPLTIAWHFSPYPGRSVPYTRNTCAPSKRRESR